MEAGAGKITLEVSSLHSPDKVRGGEIQCHFTGRVMEVKDTCTAAGGPSCRWRYRRTLHQDRENRDNGEGDQEKDGETSSEARSPLTRAIFDEEGQQGWKPGEGVRSGNVTLRDFTMLERQLMLG